MPESLDMQRLEIAELRKMRELCQPQVEWRVEHPVTGDYCFHGEKREVDEWLDDHKQRFPHSRFAGYVVKEHAVLTPTQSALIRCLDELESLARATSQNSEPSPAGAAS